jgi:hypothetical protein
LAEKTFEALLLDFGDDDDAFPKAPVFLRAFVVYGLPSAGLSLDWLSDLFFFEGLLEVVTLALLAFFGLLGGALLFNDEAPKSFVFRPDLLEVECLLLMPIFCFEGDLSNPPVFLRPLRASGSEHRGIKDR